jgi:hypothetical protein
MGVENPSSIHDISLWGFKNIIIAVFKSNFCSEIN